jgi:ATP-dependent Clp protease protease subunit
MEISYKLIKKMQRDLYEILAHHTEQPYEAIERDCDRDNWMGADDAKAYGLIDEVLVRGVRKNA